VFDRGCQPLVIRFGFRGGNVQNILQKSYSKSFWLMLRGYL